MIATKLALAAGVVVVALLVWLAVAGVAMATELLVSVAALVVLVGGGNWLAGRRGPSPGPPPADEPRLEEPGGRPGPGPGR
jgi:hypothetical protein